MPNLVLLHQSFQTDIEHRVPKLGFACLEGLVTSLEANMNPGTTPAWAATRLANGKESVQNFDRHSDRHYEEYKWATTYLPAGQDCGHRWARSDQAVRTKSYRHTLSRHAHISSRHWQPALRPPLTYHTTSHSVVQTQIWWLRQAVEKE